MDRVAFYASFYKDKNCENSIKSQYRACHVKLERHDYEVAGYYSDQRYISAPNRRDGLLRLLQDARAGKIDYVMTYNAERLALNQDNLCKIAHSLKLADVNAYTCIGDGKSLSQRFEDEIQEAEQEAIFRMAMEWEKRMDSQIELEFGEHPDLSPPQSDFTGAAQGVRIDNSPENPIFQPQSQDQTTHPESRL